MSHLKYRDMVEKHKDKILEVERYVWQHPESGYREWNTSKYLAGIFEEAGYELTYAGDIPGFYTDIETGRPGPKVVIIGELDALLCPNHPEQTNGCAHACGHNCQCAALVGAALALKEPGALDGLSGSIRLMAVPAEELIEIEYRDSLRKQGIIHYLGGKTEFMYRGYFDGCDIAYMNHASIHPGVQQFDINGCNGCIAKTVTYKGVASHAGGSPDKGVNAMYAANMGLNAINALRETFRDDEHVRVHPIVTEGGASVNIIPSSAKLQSYVRGATVDSVYKNNLKVNRALAAGALALGAEVLVEDRPGYAPLNCDEGLSEVMYDVAREILKPENVREAPWGCGSTDMGDVSCVIRAVHAHISGCEGHSHGDDYAVTDPYTACVVNAAIEVMTAAALLEDDAKRARKVMAGPALRYPDMKSYFADIDRFMADRDMVKYEGNKAIVKYE